MAKIEEPTEGIIAELAKVLQSGEAAELQVGLSEMYLVMQACQMMLTLPAEKLNEVLRTAYEGIGRKYQGVLEQKVSQEFLEFCEKGWHREYDQ